MLFFLFFKYVSLRFVIPFMYFFYGILGVQNSFVMKDNRMFRACFL